MAENKKRKKPKKRNKPYPPLSKADRAIYIISEIFALIILLGSVAGYIIFADDFIFKNPDVLAYAERWTILLMLPFVIICGILVFDAERKKLPILGNKKIDYYNTSKHRFILPLFDKRYENISNYQKQRRSVFKKASVWSVVLAVLFCIGLLGYTGHHEFDRNGITTYSIFNNPIAEYSYDEAESYEISASKQTSTSKYGRSISYEIYFTIHLKNKKSFTTNYYFARDAHALKELEALLAGKPKTIDDSYLAEFIDRHDLSDDELAIIYELFEK